MKLKTLRYRRLFILKSDNRYKHPKVWRRMGQSAMEGCEDIWCEEFHSEEGEWMDADQEIVPVRVKIERLRK